MISLHPVMKWYYRKVKEKLDAELEINGLKIINPDKFHAYTLKLTKKNVRNNIILLILAIVVILKWIYGG